MTELLWPPLLLRRSAKSRAAPNVLYSASVAEHLGQRQGHLGVYVHPSCAPWPSSHLESVRREQMPDSLELMLWDCHSTEERWDVVEELRLHGAHDVSLRYDAVNTDVSAVRSIYFPKGTFRAVPPAVCFVGLRPVRSSPGVTRD